MITASVHGKEVLTTRTDYVNKHPSLLQTKSYNFSKTNTTCEACVGVKAFPIHQKNPAQHFADLCMLESLEKKACICKPQTGLPKSIECVGVDVATDEGPSHADVQYWWTKTCSKTCNCVELQNGCLSLGHANTFIPSTLAGSCIDQDSGVINEEVLS